MPFFLHLLSSASVNVLVSKALALHSQLDWEVLRSTLMEPETGGGCWGVDVVGLAWWKVSSAGSEV